ncbi:MAG TPA: segregation/condensation protein A [Verrucomicrobiota bacterium]|jgi:segregation and condensation protein A|nr:segregation/condensation protein A [Verrucomicrobiota bacterium]
MIAKVRMPPLRYADGTARSLPRMSHFKIQFKVFEGPMDLLLFLVKKQEVDIYDVNMTELARQFIEYVELMQRFDLNLAGEFIVMASTLMYIKSRELLPVTEQVLDAEEEDAADPRWELIRRLVEYRRFKDVSDELQRLEIEREKVYTRRPGSIPIDPLPMGHRLEASIFDLVGAANELLQRIAEREVARSEIIEDRWSVSEKIVAIRQRLGQAGRLKFSELFDDSGSRGEMVATFLALLELVRLKQLRATQDATFGEIEIAVAPVEMQQIKPEQTETVTT